MKKIIYFIACITLSVISCGVQGEIPTPSPTNAAPNAVKFAGQPTRQPQPTEDNIRHMTVYGAGEAPYGLNLRTDAGQSAPLKIVNPLPDGTFVTWSGESKVIAVIPWYKVSVIVDGVEIEGWCSSQYLREVK